MGSDNNYDESAGGVTIDQERAEYHLRCLGVDCGWRAEEVEDFIKDRESAMKAMCTEVGTRGATINQRDARIAALEATERELREAVKVLAEELHSKALDRAVGKHWDAEINDAVWDNPIAAEAVREAGR